MKRLIVNADDYGLAPSITDGILKGYKDGIITSVSLLATGQDAKRAACLANEHPGLAVGVHLSIVETQAASCAKDIPSLVDSQGAFPATYRRVCWNYLLRKIRLNEVYAEFRAQIERAKSWGISISHLDSHQHLHLLPGIFPMVCRLADEFGIPRIRIARSMKTDLSLNPGRIGLAILSRRAMNKLRNGGYSLKACEYFWGVGASCRLTEEWLLSVLEKIPEGASELMCHPGYVDSDLTNQYPWGGNWEKELHAVVSPHVKDKIRACGIQLVGNI